MTAKDGSKRGAPPGEKHPNAKLTDEMVRCMREAWTEGLPLKRIAAMAGCSKQYASRVIRRENRKST